jgi:hypothetical protein
VPSGEGKATFGLQLTCDEETGEVQGRFRYNDHAEGIAFHASVWGSVQEGCMVSGEILYFQGDYTPQPKKAGEGGVLWLELEQAGDEQCLSVELAGGFLDGYVHSGCLEGGRI